MLINTVDPDWRDIANGGKMGQSDGGDILFTSSDGTTRLAHEIENYDNVNGQLVAWVNVPSISDGTVIYMYYGNSSAADQWDIENTWNSNFAMVQHMQETSGTHFDSTSNGNDGSPYGGVTQNAAGQIAGSDDFDGSNNYVAIQNLNYNSPGQINALTVCVWFNTSFGGAGWTNNWALVDFDRSEYYNFFVYGDTGELGFATAASGIVDMRGSAPANDGQWHFGCIVFDSSDVNDKKIYLDGTLDSQQDAYSTGTNLGTGTTRYGFIGDGSEASTFNGSRNNLYFDGLIDEVRISDVARSAGWIAASYYNQNSPGSFYNIGGEENESNTRYWVGGSGIWSDNNNHWSTTSGGSAGATIPGTGSTVIFDLNSGGGTCTLDGNVSIAGFNMQSGNTTTVDTSASNFALTVSGDFTISAGSFSANASIITIEGDWTNNAVFAPGTSTVTLDGTNQNISGSTTFYNLSKSVTGAATLTFDSTGLQTITNALTLNGAGGGGLLSLRSNTVGEQWDIDPQGTRNISYVDVQDSNNINATWILAVNSEASGNNTGWYFGNHQIDIDNDGTAEVAMDADDNSENGYEVFMDPDCPAPGPGKICSSSVLSTDGDRDSKTDHFIDTSGDATPEKLWDPDEYITRDIELIDVNRDGSDEWVYDSDNNGTFDFAYSPSGSRFIDPFGIVFDSATNNKIAGAVVTIYRSATGIPAVPGTDLAPGDVNPVVTGANGAYGFNTAPGDYYITVTADGYSYPFEPGSKTFDTGRTICVNNAAAGYPSAACQGQYGSRGEVFSVSTVITMDHPLDPTYNLIKLTKKANKTEATTGDIVTYTITIESKTTTDLKNVYITDKIPPAFKYITDRAILDDRKTDNPQGQRPVTFNIGTIKAGQKRILKYQLIIGSGVTFSKYENSAWATYSNGTRISNVAAEEVKIIPDPLFDLGTVIGKVFIDRNENGVQDGSEFTVHGSQSEEQSTVNGETGLANIQIMTEEGTIITIGKDGKYHLAGITPGRHILRIDERTLPEGTYLTTDKAVIIDITPGIIRKVNFGINKRQNRETEDRDQNSELRTQNSDNEQSGWFTVYRS